MTSGDFDGDGVTDLAVSSQYEMSVNILEGRAGGIWLGGLTGSQGQLITNPF